MSDYYYLICPEANEAIEVIAVVGAKPLPRISPNALGAFLTFHGDQGREFKTENLDYANYCTVDTVEEYESAVADEFEDGKPLLIWTSSNYLQLSKRRPELHKKIEEMEGGGLYWRWPNNLSQKA